MKTTMRYLLLCPKPRWLRAKDEVFMGPMRTYGISPCWHLQSPVSLTQLTICLSLTGLPQGLCICHPGLFSDVTSSEKPSLTTLSHTVCLHHTYLACSSSTSLPAFVFSAKRVGTFMSVLC